MPHVTTSALATGETMVTHAACLLRLRTRTCGAGQVVDLVVVLQPLGVRCRLVVSLVPEMRSVWHLTISRI